MLLDIHHMKVSIIDLGFNSVKLVNYEVNKNDHSFKAYQQEGIKVKLGEGLNETGYLARKPIERTIEALKMFKDIINFDSITHVLPVATSAVREAKNKEDFLTEVYKETGFQFKVISGQEEGLYSYIGALRSTCIPTSLFFDLGGGSIELVYTENYNIKKIKSYPLGALRLTQQFARKKKNGMFSKKNYTRMKEYILHTLSGRDGLENLSPDTALVGVGGTLRAMARYDQQLREYELDKIHNYQLRFSSISSIAERFYNMDLDELAEIKAIGYNRIDTVTAGSAVIDILMRRFNFDRVIVSAQGLREGILSAFTQDLNTFQGGKINNEEAKAFVTSACHEEMLPQNTATLIEPIVAAGLLRQKEKMILTHAIKQASGLPIVTNLNNLFYMIMDEDNAFLTHREQLILALSIIHTKKEKAADWLFSRYKSILQSQNKKSIEKIASCLMLSDIIEKLKANVRVYIKEYSKIDMKIITLSLTRQRRQQRQFIPLRLLEKTIKNFEGAFGVSVGWSIEISTSKSIAKERIAAL